MNKRSFPSRTVCVATTIALLASAMVEAAPPSFDAVGPDECPTHRGVVGFLMDVLLKHGAVIHTRGSTNSCGPAHRSLGGTPTEAPRGPQTSLMVKTSNGGLQLAIRVRF